MPAVPRTAISSERYLVDPSPADGQPETLQIRRRRALRQELSDVATRLFLERGFDAVRVADVAAACGVTEKTVFNHFPSKEALLSDRWDLQIAAVRMLLADSDTTALGAARVVLDDEISFLTSLGEKEDEAQRLADIRRFGAMIGSSPSLRGYQRGRLDELTSTFLDSLAERAGPGLASPETWVSAATAAGLWRVYGWSLQRHLSSRRLNRLARSVRDDLESAVSTLQRGL